MALIGICGGTGSGKSTLADKLEAHYKNKGVVKILSDSYYKNHIHLNFEERSKINFDHPNAIDFELLLKNIKDLKKYKKVKDPIYSYKTHRRLKKGDIISAKEIIILEGIHIFCDKRIVDLIDFGIFIDLDEKIRLKRRLNRDIKFRGRSKNEVEKRFYNMCKPMHENYINPSKKHAHKVLSGEKISMEKILNLISKKIIC